MTKKKKPNAASPVLLALCVCMCVCLFCYPLSPLFYKFSVSCLLQISNQALPPQPIWNEASLPIISFPPLYSVYMFHSLPFSYLHIFCTP
ncbi:hypothetical protein TESG_00497 [Trichophyton tonsurans CBS 112818]|uniref:Uncharacterized protein n=1 Tax=Trichophyton tonsurans (strain CBS 112818) TaxID=647933 RepID=F2RNN1_TRIT1|nr:hypothetical protein TESG_00497 [Trichophyton tonsurans CBS 112818]